MTMPSRRVFVVHGHDDGVLKSVAKFLEQVKLTPIILHEQINTGLTIIEKIEANSDVGFAVVLLTPDDEGCKKGGVLVPRARQNVILELGYFTAKLRRDSVFVLRIDDVEIPSDFTGVIYELFDSAGRWKVALAKALQAKGFAIPWHKLPYF
jgi:predicted nucleotide-binding protein